MIDEAANDFEGLIAGLLSGSRVHIAKALSFVEAGDPFGLEILKRVGPLVRGVPVIGLVGPPGAGKSTLVARLVGEFGSRGMRVAVLAVDPSSPITGGAVLGDRIRLTGIVSHDQVFFRSLASRGAQGAVARNVRAMSRVLDAAGFDVVLIETVGAGQSDVEIMGVADLVVVVVTPDFGDSIQAVKAGLLEIGDLYVVNKSDNPASSLMKAMLESMLSSSKRTATVMKTTASTGEGVGEVASMMLQKTEELSKTGELARRRATIFEREVMEAAMMELQASLKELFQSEHVSSWLSSELKAGAEPKELGQRVAKMFLERKGSELRAG
ncbi:MAG: methylmalonyl Co-A mutase-associated GTPase MeaB [Thaumarchaeota archaeon]|nr:methylmalonyl Co-A mutase-associated GTPase MeaB [Candidatus Calditenuaceae archaeon]MDW8186560.1 methylmalonyl Co-A mutase-associated GTPase MeaB [Nitrososphaerota archaeon]